jgi:hypothetical protein
MKHEAKFKQAAEDQREARCQHPAITGANENRTSCTGSRVMQMIEFCEVNAHYYSSKSSKYPEISQLHAL